MYNKYCTPFVAHVPYLTDDEVDVVLDEGVQAPPEVPLYLALVVRVPPGQVTGLGDPTSTTTSNKIIYRQLLIFKNIYIYFVFLFYVCLI